MILGDKGLWQLLRVADRASYTDRPDPNLSLLNILLGIPSLKPETLCKDRFGRMGCLAQIPIDNSTKARDEKPTRTIVLRSHVRSLLRQRVRDCREAVGNCLIEALRCVYGYDPDEDSLPPSQPTHGEIDHRHGFCWKKPVFYEKAPRCPPEDKELITDVSTFVGILNVAEPQEDENADGYGAADAIGPLFRTPNPPRIHGVEQPELGTVLLVALLGVLALINSIFGIW